MKKNKEEPLFNIACQVQILDKHHIYNYTNPVDIRIALVLENIIRNNKIKGYDFYSDIIKTNKLYQTTFDYIINELEDEIVDSEIYEMSNDLLEEVAISLMKMAIDVVG